MSNDSAEIKRLREDLASCTESWHRVMRNKLAADRANAIIRNETGDNSQSVYETGKLK